MKGRADTPAKKREIVENLLKRWRSNPELRLGQMIVVAVTDPGETPADTLRRIFYIEDEAMVDALASPVLRDPD